MIEQDILRRLLRLERRVSDIPRIESGAQVDYSATSTITGWTSFTTQQLYYMRVGKLVFVEFNFQGTSNSTTTSFTLPLAKATASGSLRVPIQVVDNGTSLTGALIFVAADTTVYCSTTIGGATTGTWTATGTKHAKGQFWYVIN